MNHPLRGTLRTALTMLTAACSVIGMMTAASSARAAVDVVATTPELASIARAVGGNLTKVQSLAKPDQNYHMVEAKPTDVLRVRNAQVFVRIGLDMDIWADAVLNAARNPNVQAGGKGYVDAGRLIKRMEVPSANISGASGDIHVYGNPHYWFDPGNAKVVAYEIDLALRGVDPKNAAAYDANYQKFASEIDQHIKGWEATLAPYRGRSVVAYHDEWVYFFQRFGLKAFGYLEPKPGISPSSSHVQNLITAMKRDNVKAVIIPSIYPTRFGELIARETGGHLAVVPYSIGSQGTTDYFSYLDAIVNGFKQALQ